MRSNSFSSSPPMVLRGQGSAYADRALLSCGGAKPPWHVMQLAQVSLTIFETDLEPFKQVVRTPELSMTMGQAFTMKVWLTPQLTPPLLKYQVPVAPGRSS